MDYLIKNWFGILFWAAVVAFFVYRARKKKPSSRLENSSYSYAEPDRQTPTPQTYNSPARATSQLEVKLRSRFFTNAESQAFLLLEQALADTEYRVFPKVRVLDVIDPVGAARLQTLNRLRGMHLDFLVVNAQTHQPLFIIELDGWSHTLEKQRTRDATKDAAFEAVRLPLVRLKNGVSAVQIQSLVRTVMSKPPANNAAKQSAGL